MDTGHTTAMLPGLMWREGRRLLRYQRDRAGSTSLALKAWHGDLRAILMRAQRLGPERVRALMAVEAACAAEGLCLTGSEHTLTAPWQLPERVLTSSPDALPPHPLIDWAWWMEGLPPAERPRTGLDAIARLFEDAPRRWSGLPRTAPHENVADAPVAVCLHLYYPELWPAIRQALQALPQPWDLFITIPRFASSPALQAIAREVRGVRFVPEPNRGRDVLPWLRLLRGGALDGYQWVCKLHTKKSPHMSRGTAWLDALLWGLVPPAQGTRQLLERLGGMPRAGIAGPANALFGPQDRRFIGGSAKALGRTRDQLGWDGKFAGSPYFAGTMFWFRPQAMKPLAVLAEQPEFFAIEAAQTDGTVAHAVERLVGESAIRQGFEIVALD